MNKNKIKIEKGENRDEYWNLTFTTESTIADFDPSFISWSSGKLSVLSLEKKSTSLTLDLPRSTELSVERSDKSGFCRRKSPEWKNVNSRPCWSMSRRRGGSDCSLIEVFQRSYLEDLLVMWSKNNNQGPETKRRIAVFSREKWHQLEVSIHVSRLCGWNESCSAVQVASRCSVKRWRR